MSNTITKKRDSILNFAISIIRKYANEDISVSQYTEKDGRGRLMEIINNEVDGDLLHKSSIYALIVNAHQTEDPKERLKTEDLALMPDEALFDIMKSSNQDSYYRSFIMHSDSFDYDTTQNKELIEMMEYNYGTVKDYVYRGYYTQANRYSINGEFAKGNHNGRKVDSFMGKFLNNDEIDDLVNGIYADTHTQNGRAESFGGIPAPSRKSVNIHMTSMLLQRLTGEHYPLCLIRDMIETKEISPIRFHDSNYYRKTLSSNDVNEYTRFLEKEGELPKLHFAGVDLFNELKPNLSEKEKLGILHDSLNSFPRAVAAYKFLTNNEISYDAAYALTEGAKYKTMIKNTQAYSDKLDNDFDPSSKITKKQHCLDIEVTNIKTDMHGEVEAEFELETTALMYDSLQECLEDVYKGHLSETINRGDSLYLRYEGLYSRKDVTAIKKALLSEFNKHTKEIPLAGDLVEISISEYNEGYYDEKVVKNGDKHLVVSVVNNYNRGCSLKLKGINELVDSDDTIIAKKLKLQKTLAAEKTM